MPQRYKFLSMHGEKKKKGSICNENLIGAENKEKGVKRNNRNFQPAESFTPRRLLTMREQIRQERPRRAHKSVYHSPRPSSRSTFNTGTCAVGGRGGLVVNEAWLLYHLRLAANQASAVRDGALMADICGSSLLPDTAGN